MARMARKLRIQFEGAIYHVTFRGNARQAIFMDERDRERLTARVAESAEDFGVRVFLYCWMGNHGHMLVETPHGNLSAFMGSVLTGYTVYFNLRHGRCGHLMQGRFGATLVAGDAYLLRLSRYVHLNPVAVEAWRERPCAERREFLRSYPWSSFRAYAGLAPVPEWVCRAPLLAMTPRKGAPEARYRRYVEDGLRRPDEAFRRELDESALALGPEDFRLRMQGEHRAQSGRRAKREDVSLRHARAFEKPAPVADEVCRALGMEAADLCRRRRDGLYRGIAALALIRRCGLTERAAAAELGLTSGSAVSYLVRLVRARCRADTETAELVRSLTHAEAICYFQG